MIETAFDANLATFGPARDDLSLSITQGCYCYPCFYICNIFIIHVYIQTEKCDWALQQTLSTMDYEYTHIKALLYTVPHHTEEKAEISVFLVEWVDEI